MSMSSPRLIATSDVEERESARVEGLTGAALRQYWLPSLLPTRFASPQESHGQSDPSPKLPQAAHSASSRQSAPSSPHPSPLPIPVQRSQPLAPERPWSGEDYDLRQSPVAGGSQPPSSSTSGASAARSPIRLERSFVRPTDTLQQAPSPSRVAGRALRQRTAAQKQPFTHEQLRYSKTLLRNGWEGAVVAAPRAVEQSAEELRRKKEAARARPRDDLDGWLELEDGNPAPARKRSQPLSDVSDYSSSSSSVAGESLLQKQERHKRRFDREVEDALHPNRQRKRKEVIKYVRTTEEQPPGADMSLVKQSEPANHLTAGPRRYRIPKAAMTNRASESGRRNGGEARPAAESRQQRAEHSSDGESEEELFRRGSGIGQSRKTTGQAARRKPAAQRSAREYSSDQEQRPRTSGPKRANGRSERRRAGSEPISSQPDDRQSPDRPLKKRRKRPPEALLAVVPGRGRPAKALHGFQRRRGEIDDDDILALSLVQRPLEVPLSGDSTVESSDSDASLLSDEIAPIDERKKRGFDLSKQRKKALGAMMPAVFMKKAQADLQMMKRERDDGQLSDLSANSGDEEAVRREKARKYRRHRVEFDSDESESDDDEESRIRNQGDAVTSWLDDFAPKRNVGNDRHAAHEALLDRIMQRAHHEGAPGLDLPPARKRRKQRDVADELDDLMARPRDRHRRQAPLIHLDDDSALFNFAILPMPAPTIVLHDVERGTTRDVEQWASYGRFSTDFDVPRLPEGLTLASNWLSCTVLGQDCPDDQAVDHILGIDVSLSMTFDDFQSALPGLCDAILAESTDSGSDVGISVRRACRFLCDYVQQSASAEVSEWTLSQVHALLARLSDNAVSVAIASCRFVIELSSSTNLEGDLTLSVRRFISTLLHYGLPRTAYAVREAATSGGACDDASVEAWAGLICLAISRDATAFLFDADDFWRLVREELIMFLPDKVVDGPAAGEILSYVAMLLSAISQFTDDGVTQSSPRLPAHWQLLMHSIDKILPSAIGKTDENVSNTALARRDRYVVALFGKILTTASRWRWRIDPRDDAVLPRLFDVLMGRRFSNLSIETTNDFPPFLSDFRTLKTADLSLDRDKDTIASVFCKLLLLAVPSTNWQSENERQRVLTRYLLRLTPSNTKTLTRDSIELQRHGDRSAVINRYSLAMTLALVHPPTATSRIEQARRLVSFADVDDGTRKVTIRAICTFMSLAILHKVSIPLASVLEWLASVTDSLRLEYVDVLRSQRDLLRGQKSKKDPLWSRAVLFTMILRAVGEVMRESASTRAYPVVDLMNPAWTDKLLESPVALDPMIGLEVLRLVSTFLDLRGASLAEAGPTTAMPAPAAIQTADLTESQELFEAEMFDLDDAALDGLFGSQECTASTKSPAQVADEAFAKGRANELAGDMFKLVSGIYAAESDSTPADRGAIANDKTTYAREAVDRWTALLKILVDHGQADWSGCLQYGTQSWKRISDPVGRRDVGLFLAVRIIELDLPRAQTLGKDLVEVWFQSIVARKMTIQHVLTRKLAEMRLDVFSGKVAMTLADLEENDVVAFRTKRVRLIEDALDEAGQLYESSLSTSTTTVTKQDLVNYVRSLVVSMTDQLNAIDVRRAGEEEKRRAYGSHVVDKVVKALRTGKLRDAVKTMPMLSALEQTLGSLL